MSPDRLSDARGPVLAFSRRERKGVPLADDAEVVAGRTVEEACAAVHEQMAGWRLTTGDAELAAGLMTAGSTLRRRALLMQCALAPGPVPGMEPFSVHDVPRTPDIAAWALMLPAWRAAFPPGHPDHLSADDAEAVTFLMALVDGSDMGALHRSSCLLADADGIPVAGILVNVREDGSRFDGPWIADVWRDPDLRGTGVGDLLIGRARALLAQDGHRTLTLAVTHGNDASVSYERAGFRVVMDAWMLYVSGVPAS